MKHTQHVHLQKILSVLQKLQVIVSEFPLENSQKIMKMEMFLTPGSVVGGGAPSSELPLLFCHCNFEEKNDFFCKTLFLYCTVLVYCSRSCDVSLLPTCHIEEAVVGLGR